MMGRGRASRKER